MPAILVETAFIFHPEEARLLQNPAVQAGLGRGIALGVAEFLDRRLLEERR